MTPGGAEGAAAGLRKSNPSPGNLKFGTAGMVKLGRELSIEFVEEEAEAVEESGGLYEDVGFGESLDI